MAPSKKWQIQLSDLVGQCDGKHPLPGCLYEKVLKIFYEARREAYELGKKEGPTKTV